MVPAGGLPTEPSVCTVYRVGVVSPTLSDGFWTTRTSDVDLQNDNGRHEFKHCQREKVNKFILEFSLLYLGCRMFEIFVLAMDPRSSV